MVKAKKACGGKRVQRGIGYLGLLFAVAVAGVGLAGTGALWQLESQREKEKELLFIGEEYRRAITSYVDKSPGGQPVYPRTLEDLIQDKRFPVPIRHLRRLYRDPMSNAMDWELIRQQGAIKGVASRSARKPVKQSGFPAAQSEFEHAAAYSEWQFIANGSGAPPAAPTAPAGSLPADAGNALPLQQR